MPPIPIQVFPLQPNSAFPSTMLTYSAKFLGNQRRSCLSDAGVYFNAGFFYELDFMSSTSWQPACGIPHLKIPPAFGFVIPVLLGEIGTATPDGRPDYRYSFPVEGFASAL